MFYGKFYPLQAKCAINKILPSDTTEPVVLFNNGSVAFLGRIKDTQEGPLSDKDEILFCDLMRMSSDLCVVCLLNQEVGAVFWNYYNGMMCKVCKWWRNFIEVSYFIFAYATFHSGVFFQKHRQCRIKPMVENISRYFFSKQLTKERHVTVQLILAENRILIFE